MTAPAPSGGPSPLRVGGIALLGVGAVAAIIGIGTLIGGGDGSTTAAPTASATAEPTAGATPSGTGTAPGDAGQVPVPSFGATPTTAPGSGSGTGGTGTGGTGAGAGGAGTAGAGGSGTAAGSGAAGSGAAGSGAAGSGAGGAGSGSAGATVVKAPVRVYNNSTITGLAARAADDFRNNGWTVDAVSNYPQGKIPTSTVYYRPGTDEQAAADAMARGFGLRSEPRFTGLDEASPGLIVIVTNDYQKRS